jgi:hypothetical protein
MQDIEQLVVENYQQSMEYFQKEQPELHSKLQALELLIGEGRYPVKYDLEYVDGYFDVVLLATNERLYGTNSDVHSQRLADIINYNKNEHTIETFSRLTFDDVSLDRLKNLNANHTHTTTAPIMEYWNRNADESLPMKRIYKFIFLGSGLGLHFEKTIKRIDPMMTFVVEDDIELFRLSMFVCNYKKTEYDKRKCHKKQKV